MEIKDHKLVGENVEYVEANSYAKASNMQPDSIIIHYTAGPSGKATVNLFAAKTSTLSAHFVVHEDGKVTQMVPLNKVAYHAGVSEYKGRKSFNNFSIGIEISNPGYLVKNPKGDGYVTWWQANTATPKPVSQENIFVGTHRNPITRMTIWHKYTDAQIKAVEEICKAIASFYKIQFILGHEEIAPGRKTDPGPAFPLDELRLNVLNQSEDVIVEKSDKSKIGTVTVKLNFRATPTADGDKLTSPIPPNTKVNVLKDEGDWYQIVYEIMGWVLRADIQPDNTDSDYDATIIPDSLKMFAIPEPNAELMPNPLKKDDKVNLKENRDGYVLITAPVTGWVMKKFVNV